MIAPRGIRNNNPGNIERNKTRWDGMSDDQSSDTRFCVFEHPIFGLRAMVRILINYQRRYGLMSLDLIIGRWAPVIENDTAAYALHVAKAAGLDVDEMIDFNANRKILAQIVKAMVRHENGCQPYPNWLYDHAIKLAL